MSRRSLPFVVVLMLGMVGVTYVASAGGEFSCRWTIIGYICPDLTVSSR